MTVRESPFSSRKYAMTRIDSGDYLLPSNDGKTLWRIRKYDEDGSAEVSPDGKTWKPLRGEFWMTAKYLGTFPNKDGQMPDDFLDWTWWESWETGFIKRKYAVEAVVNRG